MSLLTRTVRLIKVILPSTSARMGKLVGGQNLLFLSGMLQEEGHPNDSTQRTGPELNANGIGLDKSPPGS